GGHAADHDRSGERDRQDDARVHEALDHAALLEGLDVVGEVEPVGRQVERARLAELARRLEARDEEYRERDDRCERSDHERHILHGSGCGGRCPRTRGVGSGHVRSTFSSGKSLRCTKVTTRTITSSTIAIADASPTWRKLKAVCSVWITKVEVPLAPPVMIK